MTDRASSTIPIGIVVMRQGMNALNVIEGVKQKLREIAPSLPAGVQVVAGYDRSGLINDSDRNCGDAAGHECLERHRRGEAKAPRDCAIASSRSTGRRGL